MAGAAIPDVYAPPMPATTLGNMVKTFLQKILDITRRPGDDRRDRRWSARVPTGRRVAQALTRPPGGVTSCTGLGVLPIRRDAVLELALKKLEACCS